MTWGSAPKRRAKVRRTASRRPRALTWGAAFAFAAALGAGDAKAGATLQLAPVVIDVSAPAAVATVSVANQDPKPTAVQLRLFRWRQAGGEESLEATSDVVASPPIATIAPGATLTVRVIRAAGTPVGGEESYRLVIDQLPETDRAGRTIVSMLLRQVLPVFFGQPDRSQPDVVWSVARTGRGWALRAHNSGDRRLRVAKITLSGGGRAPLTLGGGLLGYVLGHADMSWTIAKGGAFTPGATLTVRGDSDLGAFHATAPVTSSQ